MLESWQGSLLITDEPSDFENQNGRAYVLHAQPDSSIHGYCITRPYRWNDSDEWVQRSHLFERQFNYPIKSLGGIDPLISCGGDTQNDTAFLIHDASDCWFGETYLFESSKTISDKILCVAKLEDAINHLQKTEKYPKFGTITIGYTVFTSQEVSANVASGKWQSRSLLPYPFVVFGNEMTKKVDVARDVLRVYDGNALSLMAHMLSIFDDVKIAGAKCAAWMKAGENTTPDELEEITRLMLHLEGNKEKGVIDTEHGDWQEELANFRKMKIGRTEIDGLLRSPLVERYEELENAYSNLGFDPRLMEMGLMLKMGGNKNAQEPVSKPDDKRDPTEWGKTIDMLTAVVKGRASDPD